MIKYRNFRWECMGRYDKPRSRWENQSKDLYKRAGIAIQEVDRSRRKEQRVEKDVRDLVTYKGAA